MISRLALAMSRVGSDKLNKYRHGQIITELDVQIRVCIRHATSGLVEIMSYRMEGFPPLHRLAISLNRRREQAGQRYAGVRLVTGLIQSPRARQTECD